MSDVVLVAYATRYGSTQEVAEAVAKTLREVGVHVDVQPMRKVRELGGYRAVVLGAPIYIGSLHKDAQRFLARHQTALTERPVALFALGPTHDDEEERQGSRGQLDKELAKYPWFSPGHVDVFGGRYDPAKLRFPDSLLAALPASPLHGQPASDARDWTAIGAWASSVAKTLGESFA